MLLICSIQVSLWQIITATRKLKFSMTGLLISAGMRLISFHILPFNAVRAGDYCHRYFPWRTPWERSWLDWNQGSRLAKTSQCILLGVQRSVSAMGWRNILLVNNSFHFHSSSLQCKNAHGQCKCNVTISFVHCHRIFFPLLREMQSNDGISSRGTSRSHFLQVKRAMSMFMDHSFTPVVHILFIDVTMRQWQWELSQRKI